MRAVLKNNTSRQPLTALRLHRPLLPIEQYAKREGTTVEDIEHCGKIGILQLRRKNGKTYVVDIPVCSYESTAEIDAEIADLIDNPKKNSIEPLKPQNQNPPVKETNHHRQIVKPGSISELVSKMVQRIDEIKADDEIKQTQTCESIKEIKPKSSLPQATLKVIDSIKAQLDQIESKLSS